MDMSVCHVSFSFLLAPKAHSQGAVTWIESQVSRFAGSFLFAFKKKRNEETVSILLQTGKTLKQVQGDDFHVN
ncbi:MAG TPA: hypothetical protein P5556_03635 [Candidatus Gastranaerophilales bacterium]|nr:hypothetical protein [Candidatus Gastranaerophilales bacterium]